MNKRTLSDFASPTTALLCIFVQVLVLTVFGLFVSENEILSSAFVSSHLSDLIIEFLGGSVRHLPDRTVVSTPMPSIMLCSLVITLVVNLLASGLNQFLTGKRSGRFSELSLLNSLWTVPLAIWICLWISGQIFPSISLFAAGTVNLFVATTCAGWMYSSMTWKLRPNESEQKTSAKRAWLIVWTGIAIYVLVFTTLNWALWFNLRIPHGDSAMYEEHLWNLTHGKGFRSYLDQGLFLGEHIQVIHLLLVPLYWIWPSHLLLELCETLALALGAIPTFLIARRYSKSDIAAALLASAYLLYFPLHYLDIAADLKTFRPISFGVPLMLWAINALEQKQWKQMVVAFLLALACKEDFAIVIAPLGLWAMWNEWSSSKNKGVTAERSTYWIGIGTACLATAYLLFVVKIAIPWFRSGETVHYARYFEEFGKTPTEIVITMMTSPHLLFDKLVTFGSILYFLRVLFPLGMPLRGCSQLLVGAPLFVLLCLNTIAMQPPIGPYHHFHAPLVPIVIWAACASLGQFVNNSNAQSTQPFKRACWIFSCAFFTSILFSYSPLSIRFWDPGQEMYWRNQYVMDERAKQFENVIEQIPQSAKVASTDYVHSRLTHFERSYDYSDYPRAVANYEDKVPDDTDYIVIDHRHKHSLGKYDNVKMLRELQQSPEEWEILPDRTNGYFTILKRRKAKLLVE